MSNQPQKFLAESAQSAASDLVTALMRLPEDKRNWGPMGEARTALDMVAECAILNGGTAELIKSRSFEASHDMDNYMTRKAELVGNWDACRALLEQNTERVADTIGSVPSEALGEEVMMPWGPMTIEEVCSYPYWNMKYHEGQINYIASMLGCLK